VALAHNGLSWSLNINIKNKKKIGVFYLIKQANQLKIFSKKHSAKINKNDFPSATLKWL